MMAGGNHAMLKCAYTAAASLAVGVLTPSAMAASPQTPVTYQLQATAPASSPVIVTGTLQIKVTVAVNSKIPAGTEISFQATAQVYDTTLVYNGSNSIGGTAKVANGQATATLETPYRWPVLSTNEKITIELVAFASYTKGDISYQDSQNVTVSFPIPNDGSTTIVPISTSF